MRKLTIALLVAAGAVAATPAFAQGIYFGAGPGGVGVGVAGPGYYDGHYGPRYRHRSYHRSYAYDRGYARCRTRIVETRYGTRKVRRCF